MGEIFANPLTELAEYGDMKQDLMKGKGPVQICGVTDSQKVHVMYQVSEEKAWRLVVTHDDTRARELYDDFSYFEKNTWLYPARDLLFYSSDIHGNLLTRQRMQVFKHLMEDVGGTVVTTVDGLMDHLLPLSMMKERRILVESGEVLDIGDMKERLRDLGYERTGQVDGMGQFSIRGGIIDIFPLTEELPVRIELWGDEVDSIRSFDPESQRSITQMDSVLIYPAAELTLTKEQMENGTDRIEKEGKKQEKAFREAGKPEDPSRPVSPGEILVTYGKLHKGFEYPLIKFVVITEGDMFGNERRQKKRKKYNYEGKKISSFSELSVGDYVVHESHGLGIYRGIEKIEQDHVIKDYIKVEYADGGNLYLPATRLDGIQKYAGADAKTPKLNKLGGAEWGKTKTRVRTAVREIAKELVELYAARQDAEGFVYGEDTVWQKEFEEMFPYEETDDQLSAIEDTKKDMESRKIMDRLICGDVGYGKTEIALRAAFKAVQEGKQVVYLVPTTILAQQHYNTFIQRMKDFPVRVDLMSRFKTPADIKKTLEGLKKGFVDIVIGTHRVLSKDVQFKDLGLLIIDEEQRFGVAHKEKIKQLKQNVDVLTLTATPIPRTLHMSLIGIRDMSVLEEPPMERVPIQTYVMEYNDEMVREAIHRELARGGQVYYVYNRVSNIDEIAGHVASLVPDAQVAFAHGQMNERQLERIMLDFVNGDIDVLVSTTIIETGLDIPNANTMIIHDADRLGLSQLYQIRGRIGRSNRTSFAFLMYKRDKMLREEAEKRLQAIREFTELGSGIKIAMRDLEIRGAGNILGAEQHGHMEAVGYDLYCKMLNEAVLALKGETTEEESFETVVDCDIDAFIPDGYIKNEYLKLDVYKRISAIENEEEYMDMQDELIDRFGDIPRPVENLLKVAELKATAHRAYVTEVAVNRQEIRMELYPKAKLDVSGIPGLIGEYKNALRFVQGEKPMMFYQDKRNKNKDCGPMMEKAREILERLGGLAG